MSFWTQFRIEFGRKFDAILDRIFCAVCICRTQFHPVNNGTEWTCAALALYEIGQFCFEFQALEDERCFGSILGGFWGGFGWLFGSFLGAVWRFVGVPRGIEKGRRFKKRTLEAWAKAGAESTPHPGTEPGFRFHFSHGAARFYW